MEKKKGKIGIVTIHMINNYGAVEQAYALNKFLRQYGYDVETIDLRTYRVAESYNWLRPVHSVMDLVRNLQSVLYYPKLLRRNRRFENFVKHNIPLSDKIFYSNEELKQADLDYDYYICGSDQIWNTFCENYDDAFLLDFAKGRAPRIAYAASLGHDAIHDNLKQRFCCNLPNYKAISVREASAVPIIEEIAKKQVSHVVDPVFLLDGEQWSKVASDSPIDKPYIFCYYVKGDLPGMRDYAKKLSRVKKMPVVVVTKDLREMLYLNKKCYDAGPAEFLSLIKNADYVCTNSFHACAFSIIFKRKFIIFTEKKSPRLQSILGTFGLLERLVTSESNIETILSEIDYAEVHKKLESMRASSIRFLLDAVDYKD